MTAYRKYNFDNGTPNNININDSSFDGFVIPNGRTFTCAADKFKSACRLYAGNENATSFKVPDLSSKFFKCDPGLPVNTMSPMANVNGNTVFIGHSHSGNVNIAQSVNIPCNDAMFSLLAGVMGTGFIGNDGILIAIGGDRDATDGDNPWMAYDDYPANYKPGMNKIDLTATVNGGFSCAETGDNAASYPVHKHIQALLYIGKSWE